MPLTFQDISAWIEVDGSELSIFDIKQTGNEVTCWIPSESEKKFSVKLSTGKRAISMVGDIFMDGKCLSGKTMKAGEPQTFTSSGVLTTATSERPFVFSKLELTDDDEYLNMATAGLGDVKLVISHATFGVTRDHKRYKNCDTIGKVHEKSKKATGHRVGLGAEKPVVYTKSISVRRHAALVKFVFRYRPIDMLRANGIAPLEERKKRIASPSEPEVLDLTGDSDDEEERRMNTLREELQALERKRRKTKHVKSEPGVEPKHEPGTFSSRIKRGSRKVSPEVVDLT
ncbi:hypothetical protein DFH05DRAFT_1581901 [Lentinula detonsa]|uniref:DUF7918 domain-containing protein n=1 Tax=Lentinula detonsa TaxID=2804962 RepID=A0A9W8NTN5_9AGAR|nr:hypothetical protein DFH05DRAFT_1581901 [Lentinula detonsa]KAJ3988000.1 hypothetical protein F5890DRAFT_1550932 [Lentinula detonsa]